MFIACILSKILDGIPEAVDISEHKLMDSSWDMTVNGRNSLMILNQAPYSLRTTNPIKVKGFQQFEKQKREMIKRQDFMETLADRLYKFIEVTALVIFCYAFTSRF